MSSHPPLVDAAQVVAQCRAREAQRRRAAPDPQPLPPPLPAHEGPFRLVVVVPRTDVGGGARVLCEHASRLADRGHDVVVLGHGPAPAWAGLRAPYRQVPLGLDLADAVPAADVVLAGYWDQVRALRAATGLPVLHLEQGDAHLFEDLEPVVEAEARRCLRAASATATPSRRVRDVLQERYGVASSVVPNGLDPEVFRPDAVVPASAPERPYLVTVGWDGNAFKGLDVVRAVWERLRERGRDLDLVRLSPHPPLEDWGTVVVAPPQDELAGLLRGAAAFLGASRYEAWGLPAMEAMACGTPVVSTAHTGVLEYAQDGVDLLLAPVDDVDALVAAVEQVLDEPDAARARAEAGLATARRHTWDAVVPLLEEQLRALVRPAPVVPPAWTISSPGPLGSGDDERLARLLESTRAREVHLPVHEGLPGGTVAARWAPVARRKRGEGVVRLHAPVEGGEAGATRRLVLSGRAREALPSLAADVERRRGHEQVPATLWLVLALLQAGDAAAALGLARDALAVHPDHADFARLGAVAAATTGDLPLAEALVGLAELVGTGARHDEWFVTLAL